MDKFKKSMIGGRISAELSEKVKTFAETNNCNVSNVVELALAEFFKEKTEEQKDDFVINLKTVGVSFLSVVLEIVNEKGYNIIEALDILSNFVIEKAGEPSLNNIELAEKVINENLKSI